MAGGATPTSSAGHPSAGANTTSKLTFKSDHQSGAGHGVDLTTVAYNDSNGSRTVTNALGEQEIYKFTTLQGAPKVSEIDRLASAGVAAATRKFSYYVNGYLASSTDYDGNVTTYTHDARGDETSRTEPAGTALARTTTTTWLPTLHLPTSITEPGRVTNLTYDANGNLLGRTVTAGPLNRSWAYTYNGTGEVQTATDPRGNVTTFTYDSTGDIATITDALSHVTSLTSYDANGRPLSITDPNGLVATLAYNFRGEGDLAQCRRRDHDLRLRSSRSANKDHSARRVLPSFHL